MFHTFMGVELEIGPNVLVPRAETELLGRVALEMLQAVVSPTVIDMCCGSGNVGLGIAAERPDARIFGGDITHDTVATARRNAHRLGLADRAIYEQSDMFGALETYGIAGQVDLVACNPPYISTQKLETESAHLLEHEPREAFDAGPYGIAIHQRLIAEAAPFLRTGGWLVFEFGAGQDWQTRALLSRNRAYGPVTFRTDADGTPRVAVVQKL